jgi:hypothetical protein
VQPPILSAGAAYPAGVTVEVGIYSFPSNSDVTNAITNWNNKTALMCGNVALFSSTSPGSIQTDYITFQAIPQSPGGKTVRGQTDYVTTDSNGRLRGAVTAINNLMTNPTTITQVVAHELGHTLGLNDCSQCGVNSTIMEVNDPVSTIDGQINPATPTTCDLTAITQSNFYPCGGGGSGGGCQTQACGSAQYCPGSPCGNGGTQYCCVDGGGQHPCCTNGSPIIIDTENEGFHLTGLTEGVRFPNRTGEGPNNISWTDPHYHNAWLALDRNGNGRIDSLSELFGNYTPQPASANRNGYAALAVFDDLKNGGNGDGILDPNDAVYAQLRLWIDLNHDGISQPGELFTLPEAGLFSINLRYHEDDWKDQYGNEFRYRSSVVERDSSVRNACYDVFLLEELK